MGFEPFNLHKTGRDGLQTIWLFQDVALGYIIILLKNQTNKNKNKTTNKSLTPSIKKINLYSFALLIIYACFGKNESVL